jgi:hypothetical protein
MQKLLATFGVLVVIATTAFAQSFDPENGTGNVLTFGGQPAPPQKNKIIVRQSGIRAYGMVPRRSLSATRHREGTAYEGSGFVPGNGAVPEVNDPVGLVSPQADFSRPNRR